MVRFVAILGGEGYVVEAVPALIRRSSEEVSTFSTPDFVRMIRVSCDRMLAAELEKNRIPR